MDGGGSHRHPLAITPIANHSHNIIPDGGHVHPFSVNTGGSHSHTVDVAPTGNHNHDVGDSGKHNHTVQTGPVANHNHTVGTYGGAGAGQTKIPLHTPWLALLPVIKAYYVGPKTTKNW